ncbi:hypothetical protein NDU88_007927 [Pleurodeles waltl]|uniref:Uncharacterized protein n=1 Tax=Pleurodeles waltl TaxID=8319 RepID=A0AAV7N3J5_PLEWA|nr:hypothetical protein NDU88_007927 [Pleurodeles waltl]
MGGRVPSGENSQRSNRVLCEGRGQAPNDEVPQEVRRATLGQGTLGKRVLRLKTSVPHIAHRIIPGIPEKERGKKGGWLGGEEGGRKQEGG